MAYRKQCLVAVGGFDPTFWVAGDDVDLCWRIQDKGWVLGFSPSAVVWHHRRHSISRYLKQQRGYAKAEALLAEKWPSKYNSAGQLTWHGRLYGRGNLQALILSPRIYHGTWGTALFQSLYEPASGMWSALPRMPEWYLMLTGLGALAALGLSWPPLLAFVPVFTAATALTLGQALQGARKAVFHPAPNSGREAWRLRTVVAVLDLLQPVARLVGRAQHGLGPWRRRSLARAAPFPTTHAIWCERWAPTEARLADIEAMLHEDGAVVVRGGNFDRWDLAIRGGLFGSVRALAMVEEHGAGKQLFRIRAWPAVPAVTAVLIAALTVGAVFAGVENAWVAALSLAGSGATLALLAYQDCALALQRWSATITAYSDTQL